MGGLFRGRGLLIAWIALFVLMGAAAMYAEFTYDGGRSAGSTPPAGQSASGDAVDPSGEGGEGADSGTALVGARPGSASGSNGTATGVRDVDDRPAEQKTAEQTAPAAAPPAPEPPRIRPGRRVGPPPREAFAVSGPPADGKPRIAIIMNEIGLARARSRQARPSRRRIRW